VRLYSAGIAYFNYKKEKNNVNHKKPQSS
jgi:hypothetical protein